MNLEQIDTSTTAGKAEVMRLAAEGRRLAYMYKRNGAWAEHSGQEVCNWDWSKHSFAIISEPVGPEEAPAEIWIATTMGSALDGCCFESASEASQHAGDFGGGVVRYIRADLAGEKG